MKKIFLPVLLFLSLIAFSQPQLVGALQHWGQKHGGGIYRVNMPGTTPGVIHSFNNLIPHRPLGGVCAGNDDWLYGMVYYNGVNSNGGLYRIRKNGTGFAILHGFSNNVVTNAVPYYHTDDKIYFAGDNQLLTFDPVTNTKDSVTLNAYIASRNLLIDANEWLYFLSAGGFSLHKTKTDASAWTILHTFNGPTQGIGGSAGITEIPGDSLFGVQTYGGTSDAGTIFSIKKDGTAFAVHHHFTAATGIYPTAKLIYFDGRLFGTTLQGGNFNNGVLYTINPNGSGYRVLHHFEPGDYSGTALPGANITISSNGRIFGAFGQFYAELYLNHRLFKVDTSGQDFETFFNVDQREHGNSNLEVLLLNDDSIFLTTTEMGRHDGGVLSACDTMGSASTLYQFGYSANGFRPDNLMKASDGKLYGTASIGGTAGNGIIFSMNADGTTFTKLHEFTDAEGYQPSGKLLEASDGKLYGACRHGGANGLGSLYRIDKNGNNFTIIYSYPVFDNGYSPVGGLVEDNSGKLYGVNFWGAGSGSIFKVDKNGSNFTLLKAFTGGNELAFPYSGLTLSGNFLYGACGYGGGVANKGGVFRMKTDGTAYQVLHAFAGADGELPVATPVIASNGKLYGTTAYGGNNLHGTIFRIDTTGSNFVVLKHFLESADGAYLWGGLIQASDGLIYATTTFGINGASGGNIVRMNLDGSNFTIVRSFDMMTEGQGIMSIIDLNGNFVLPVQLFTFTAQKANQTGLLNWKTTQELNSSRFDVERSADGNTFKTIGSLAAAGNTNTTTSYSFTDAHPIKGANFYRLKQIDIDGSFTYSKVVPVNFSNAAKLILSPNPASDHLIVQLPHADYSSLNIFDAAGKLMMQKNIAGSSTIRLSIHHLPKGSYVLRLIGKEHEQIRFIKN